MVRPPFDGKEEVVPIHPRDFEHKKFRRFQLTQESIESKAALEAFLGNQQDQGNLVSKSFKVHDLKEWRGQAYQLEKMETIRATYYGKFQYYVLGWLLTKFSDWKIRKNNRARRKRV